MSLREYSAESVDYHRPSRGVEDRCGVQDDSRESINPFDDVFLSTIGVDVGSSTFHLMFSEVHLRRNAEFLSSRYETVERRTLWQSEIGLTPYKGKRIDADAVQRVIAESHVCAGLRPEDVDSGAVILTGEALRKQNARALAEAIAAGSGKFVCISAGHHLEAMLAAFGSGAVKYSEDNHLRLFHIDIGGGTTKLALIDNGQVRATAAVLIGGRQIAMNHKREVVSTSAGAVTVARQAGIEIRRGEVLSEENERRFVDMQMSVLIDLANGTHCSELERKIRLTRVLPRDFLPDAVSFSGGVSEYIYGHESRGYGDLGPQIGQAVRVAAKAGLFELPIVNPGPCIRATVIGASQCSVQLSGNTVTVSDRTLLPLRNVPVVHPDLQRRLASGPWEPKEVSRAIRQAINDYGLTVDMPVALAFSWRGECSYQRMAGLAMAVQQTLGDATASPLIVLIDHDIGASIGRLLLTEYVVDRPLVCLDGLELSPLDFVDVGQILEPSGTLPVMIKSLLFPS